MEFVKWCRLQWDRALAAVATLSGVVLVILGWVGVSGTPYIAEQVPFVVSYGLGGVVLIIIGATLWLSADMNDEWRTLDRLEAAQKAGATGAAELAELTARVHALEADRELARSR